MKPKRLPHGLRALYIKSDAFKQRVNGITNALDKGLKYEHLESDDKLALEEYFGRKGVAKFTN